MEYYFFILCSSHQDRPAKIGEKVSFFPTLLNRNGNRKVYNGTIRWKLEFNGEKVLDSGEFSSAGYSGAVTFTADKAGWYCGTFEGFVAGEKVAELNIGAIASPETIRPALPVPDDFTRFWARHLKKLAQVPLEYKLAPLDSSDIVECFDLKSPCVDGQDVSGIFVRPKDRRSGGHPAVLLPHGAGVRSAGYGRLAQWGAKGFIALDINAHGLENGRDLQYYQDKADNELAEYTTRGFDSGNPDNVYAANMFLRVVRALEVLAFMPEWDGRNLWIFGGSQGAWQSLAGAYLMPKVSGIACWIPAGCNMYEGGWPFACLAGREKPEALRKTIPYFDGCSFAAGIENIPVHFSVGLTDYVCRADGVMAAFNSLKTPHKELDIHYQMQHETMESVITALERFIIKNLK